MTDTFVTLHVTDPAQRKHASMPDTNNELLRSLHEERVRRRGIATDSETPPTPSDEEPLRRRGFAAEPETVPLALSDQAAPSPACYGSVPVLALDLDGTLLHSTCPGTRPDVPFSFTNGEYETRLRPGLREFIESVSPHFELAIFTAANSAYAERMIDGIDAAVPGFRASLRCVFSRERVEFTYEDGRMRVTKDLRSLARYCGRPMCRCLIVDDTPETYRFNPSNALPVPVYDGASSADRALHHLRVFLLSMPRQSVPLDVRAWPLAPRGAQPLLAEQDVATKILPAFLPPTEAEEIL